MTTTPLNPNEVHQEVLAHEFEPASDMQVLLAKAQLILEFLRISSFDKESGLLTKNWVARRERLAKMLEELLIDL